MNLVTVKNVCFCSVNALIMVVILNYGYQKHIDYQEFNVTIYPEPEREDTLSFNNSIVNIYVRQDDGTNSMEQNFSQNLSGNQDVSSKKIFHLIVVACGSINDKINPLNGNSGSRQFNQIKGLIKSAILMTQERLHFHFIVDDDAFYDSLTTIVDEMLELYRNKVVMTKHDAWFPQERPDLKTIFKPCATERLFIPLMFPDLSKIVYIDTDTVFLRPPEHLFQLFNQFNEDQFISMNVNNLAWKWLVPQGIPIYKNGFNSGVMLMDIQKARRPERNWLQRVLEIIDNYKEKLRFGDQDVLNILFASSPENIFDLPCHWNLLKNDCETKDAGKCRLEQINEVSLVHGGGSIFIKPVPSKLKLVYETFINFDMSTQLPLALPKELKKNIEKNLDSPCARVKGFDEMILKWPKTILE